MKNIKEARKKSKIPSSVKEAEEGGWERGPYALMSYPPKYTYSKGKRSYLISGDMPAKPKWKQLNKNDKRPQCP